MTTIRDPVDMGNIAPAVTPEAAGWGGLTRLPFPETVRRAEVVL